ncbi:hypothetical protein [Hydrocarboniphaga sp.]|uniref:baseplate hub domain-containing protein n=1 Tax=Hydrocarboniphaga sp. TaxID=2033016 RepID=UPI003D104DE2
MTRSTLTSAVRTASAASVVRMITLTDIAFPSGTIRITDGDRPILFNGFTYSVTAVPMAPPGDVEESLDGQLAAIRIVLSGVDAALKNAIMTDAYSFATVNLYLLFCDEAWNQLGSYTLAAGRLLSNCSLSLDSGSADIELMAESPQVLDTRDSAVLASPESQRLRYPGDAGLDRVAAINGMQIEWGTETVSFRDQWKAKVASIKGDG